MAGTSIATAKTMANKRPYVIVGVFVIGMLLTPPDVISQTLLAIPMWILFEFGVMVGAIYGRKSKEEEHQEVS